jgi:hypothetical protein
VKLLSGLAAMVVAVGLAACVHEAAPAVSPEIQVPPDSASVCAGHCSAMGLELSAVVLVGNRIGCVCAPSAPAPSGAPGASRGGAAAATAISMVIDDEAAAAAAAKRRRSSQQRRTK